MTSTPVSLNDESLNGSWIDINSASQIHSPIDDDSPELLRPPHALAESVQNLGLISFQVERFLQEAQRGNNNNNNNGQQQTTICDNISDMYLTDSDESVEGNQEGKTLINSLRRHHLKQKLKQQQQHQQQLDPSNNNDNQNFLQQLPSDVLGQRLSKSGECLLDQVSDSLSLLSRASLFAETPFDQATNFQDFDWLWDWTAQPEYFAGQEWKVNGPKQQEFLLAQQRQYYLSNNHGANLFSGEMMSLLFLTNIISILIGSGLTYSILMRRSTV